jgi:hypothetical protein
VALIAAIAAAVVALPSVRNGFVEDDQWVVAGRAVLQHPPSLRALLAEPYWPRSFRGSLWRPVLLASWALDYQVSSRPAWFHAVNVAWAAAAAAALALLAFELGGPAIGLAAGLVFAVHPVHVEATAGVVGRGELIAAAGYAFALLCALRFASSSRRLTPASRLPPSVWLCGVALAAALAIGAKEHAATLPVAVLLAFAARRERWRAALKAAACAVLPIVIYFAIRPAITGGALDSGGMAPGLEGLAMPARASVMLALSLEWWRLCLLPLHLSADYSPADVSVATGFTVKHLLAAMIWIGAAVSAWRLRRSVPGVALGLAWLVLTLSPVANVLVPTEILIAERTLYLPVWGVALALASIGVAVPAPGRAKAAVLALVVVALAVRSLARVGVWRDSETFYAALLRDAPRSYRTLWLEGNDAFAAQRSGTGERLLRAAMAAAPGIPGPRETLAQRYAEAGLWPQAAELLQQSIPLNETRSRPWTLLPAVLLGGGDTAAAVAVAREGAARFPRDADVTVAAIRTLLAAKRCAAAYTILHERPGQLSPAWQAEFERSIAECHPD